MTTMVFIAMAEMFRANRPTSSEDGLWNDRHSREEAARESGRQDGALAQWETCVDDFASLAAQWNPRFDRARFFRACGR